MSPRDRRRVVPGGGEVRAHGGGPAAAAHRLHQIPHPGRGLHRSACALSEEATDGHVPRRQPRLEQRHRAHPYPRHAPCAGVARDVVGGRRGAGQNEPSRPTALVGDCPDLVPHLGRELPLVEQPRLWSRQQPGRVHLGREASARAGPEHHLAAGMPATRRCLAASPRTLQHNCGQRLEPGLHLGVHNPRRVPARRAAIAFHNSNAPSDAHPMHQMRDSWCAKTSAAGRAARVSSSINSSTVASIISVLWRADRPTIAVGVAVAALRNARSVLDIGLAIARIQGTLPAGRVWVALVQGAGARSTTRSVRPCLPRRRCGDSHGAGAFAPRGQPRRSTGPV